MPLHTVAVVDVFVLLCFRQIPTPAPQVRVVDVDPAEEQPGVPSVVGWAVLGHELAGKRVQGREAGLGGFAAGQLLGGAVQGEQPVGRVDFNAEGVFSQIKGAHNYFSNSRLNHAIVRPSPSSVPTRGVQPSRERALAMSGRPDPGVALRQIAEGDAALGTRHGDDLAGQVQHGDFTGVAEIDRGGHVGQHELVEAVDQIAVMADAARLLAIAIDGQIVALEGLDGEVRHGPTVVLAHALAIRIEYARNAHIRAVHAMVRHGHGLGKALGLVVHAADANGVDVAEVLLGLGMHQGVAIDFRSGGQQELGLFGHSQPQGLVRAQRAYLEDVDTQPLKVGRASRAGEVQDEVERAIYVDVVGDIVLNKLESRMAEQMGDVLGPAREEVVHADDFAAFFQQ